MTRTLIVARHGHAYGDTLSDKGEDQVAAVARKLIDLGTIPDVIYHSPAGRTTETATIFRDIFNELTGKNIPMVAQEWLNFPSEDKGDMVDHINTFDDAHNTVLAISHEPQIKRVTYQLTGSVIAPDHANLYMLACDGDHWAEVKSATTTRGIFPFDEDWIKDPKRFILTRFNDDMGIEYPHNFSKNDHGKNDINRLAQILIKLGIIPNVIDHSPLPRAIETADAFRNSFNALVGKDIPMRMQEWLAATHEATIENVRTLDELDTNVLAVSHKPTIIRLAKSLTGDSFTCSNFSEISIFRPDRRNTWKDMRRGFHIKDYSL